MDIPEIINNIYPISAESANKIIDHTSEINLTKGHLLLKAGKTENCIYFIKEGLVRAFHYSKDYEVTFWFGSDGDPVLSMQSYIKNKPGYESIELLEDSKLFKINILDLQKLYSENIEIANWGRKFAENELLKTEENFISRQFKTALERYEELIQKDPYLIQRVQLGYIASYLGITQVTLSRIRAEIGSSGKRKQ